MYGMLGSGNIWMRCNYYISGIYLESEGTKKLIKILRKSPLKLSK